MAKKSAKVAKKARAGRIAVLAEEVYEDLEAWYPILRFREAGYDVDIIGPEKGKTYNSKHGYPLKTDLAIDSAKAGNYAGVFIPGGYAPDKMRRNAKMVKFVRDLNAAGKLVAAICHAGWMLAEADIVRGRRFTSVGAIKTDVINAGGKYFDKEVVIDGNLITSRTPPDLPAQMKACLEFLDKAGR